MNPSHPYMDVQQPHAPPPPGPASSLAQYSNYGQPQALQAASHGHYQSAYPPPYAGYSSMPPMAPGHHVTSSMGGPMSVPHSLPLPTISAPQPTQQAGPPPAFDNSGQVAPPGMKPRVTATLWEDEGSLCFQVEANGVCVARREDNHMINGTKLLNVAGMTRGRRDGILKSEKTRHVVKIGPMHLKGVWIPFDRALDFANKEKITEMLYPLFVHNIGALLYHPSNQGRQGLGNAAMAARRPDQQPQQPQPQQQPQGTPPPTQQRPVMQQVPDGRPALDRAYTFPTPPTSASSLTMGVANAGNSYEYTGQPIAPVHSASTPPGQAQSLPPYHGASQPYDQSRSMYPAPSTFSGYPSQHLQRFGPNMHSSPGPGMKTEMGPPSRGPDGEHPDVVKPHDGYGPPHDADGDHEGDYTHNRPLPSDSSHVSPEMTTHSPHQNGSGRATPRTTNPYSPYSNTPQRGPAPGSLPSSNLAYVMSNDARNSAPPPPQHQHPGAGPPAPHDAAAAQAYPSTAGYPPQPYPPMNGGPPPSSAVGVGNSNGKRGRDLDDEDPYGRPLSTGPDSAVSKKQRTDATGGGPVGGRGPVALTQPTAIKSGGSRR